MSRSRHQSSATRRIDLGPLLILTLRHARQGWIEAGFEDRELHLLVVVGDRRDLVEKLFQTFADKPIERLDLDLDQIRHLQDRRNS